MNPRDPRPFPPLPQADLRPRGLFVDLWGTLLEIPRRGWCSKPSEMEFTPGSLDALFKARQAGWKVYLVGNESAVAEGRVDDAAHEEIRKVLAAELAAAGVSIQRDYTCTDDPRLGQGHHCRDSVYRLPNTGAFHHARHFDRLRLEDSWVIGDSTLELVAGWRAGCRTAAVESGLALSDQTFGVDPGYRGRDLASVVAAVLEATSSLCH